MLSELESAAFHEAGHAVAACTVPGVQVSQVRVNGDGTGGVWHDAAGTESAFISFAGPWAELRASGGERSLTEKDDLGWHFREALAWEIEHQPRDRAGIGVGADGWDEWEERLEVLWPAIAAFALDVTPGETRWGFQAQRHLWERCRIPPPFAEGELVRRGGQGWTYFLRELRPYADHPDLAEHSLIEHVRDGVQELHVLDDTWWSAGFAHRYVPSTPARRLAPEIARTLGCDARYDRLPISQKAFGGLCPTCCLPLPRSGPCLSTSCIDA